MISYLLAQVQLGDSTPEAGEAGRTKANEPDAGDLLGLPRGIGEVEEGSLEEAIWRDLGALPPSRQRRGRFGSQIR